MVYLAASRGLTRCQVLDQYQAYGDSILGTHGNGRPNVRDLLKPLLNLFQSESGNSLWKRKEDTAFRECRTVGALLEESLRAISDCILDSPISGTPESGEEDVFANVHDVLPPPYEVGEQLILCAFCNLDSYRLGLFWLCLLNGASFLSLIRDDLNINHKQMLWTIPPKRKKRKRSMGCIY